MTLKDSFLQKIIRFFGYEWSGALIAIFVLSIAIELSTDGQPFFHPSNLMTILNNAAAVGVIAGGMTVVILTAGIDLSVGSVMGLIAALTGYVASFWGIDPSLAIGVGLLLAVMVGAVNGLFISYWKMPAFIVTLAGLSMWRGIAHLSTGAVATPKLDETFDYFGRYNPLSWFADGFLEQTLPNWLMPIGKFIDANWFDYFRSFQMSLVILILFFICLSLIINNTKLGRYIYAIGSNEQGARQAGINTEAYKFFAYVFCTLSVALGALLFLGRAPYAKSDYGQMWELDAIAAVVIGGTSLFGGKGTIWGTFLGIILLKLINNGLTLAQLETFWQMVVTGLIILVAVGIDIVRQSQSAIKLKNMLFFTTSVLVFFVLIDPLSKLLKSWLSIFEHSAMNDLMQSGASLASTQAQRVLSSEEIIRSQELVSANLQSAIYFGLLFAAVIACIFFAKKLIHYVVASGLILFTAMSFAMDSLNYAFPFLLLASLIMIVSMKVEDIFEYAKTIEEK